MEQETPTWKFKTHMFLNGSFTDMVPGSFPSIVSLIEASLTQYIFAEPFSEQRSAVIAFHVAHMWIQNPAKPLDRGWKILINLSQL